MASKRRKKQGSPVLAFRVDDPQVAAYLATLQGKARSAAIREALGEWFDRRLEGAERKERALRGEIERLRADADALNLWIVGERKRQAEYAGELEAARTKRHQSILEALEVRRREGKPVGPGWVDSPAGLAWCNGLKTDKEEVMELVKRGMA